VLACRSKQKGDALAARLRADAAAAGLPPPQLEVALLDLDSLASVRAFVDAWEASGRPLHILINNAGVFHMGGAFCTWAVAVVQGMGAVAGA
jgi:NAD(P)-dependent dehydrogenase (short-subunit alcohol dehydrogenase family)